MYKWLAEQRFADVAQGRNNNFNLIRIIAAYSVLISHSYVLVSGTNASEPLKTSLGMSLGSIAVDIFFVTSGFLVTASLLQRKNILEFTWARFLRIFPALVWVIAITVFLLGPIMTTVPLGEYFASKATYIYLLKCTTLFSGVAYELPGVFEANPFKGVVNGSIWTLPKEVQMYAILAVLWGCLFVVPKLRESLFRWAVFVSVLVSAAAFIGIHFELIHGGDKFIKLFFMFFVGAAFFMLKQHIVVSRPLFYLLMLILVVAAIDSETFFIAYIFTLPYLLFYIAYAPSKLRIYNKIGDYSYGVYIYAFPFQQLVIALKPNASVLDVILLASIPTVLCAVLSWHFLEKNALKLKSAIKFRQAGLATQQ